MRFLLLAVSLTAVLPAAKTLDIYFIDVEGGQATLIVSPSGQSMLVDAGWAGNNSRDAERIAAAGKLAGVKQIDYFVATHYHADHIGGVPQLAAKVPVIHFVDHGPSVESGKNPDELFAAYRAVRDKAKHIQVKPGDKIPVKGLDVVVLTAGGELIASPVNGGGAANPLCAKEAQKREDKTENARSVGTLTTFGKFRFVDLGDLTWNKELELICPNNRVGNVDVYLTTHHGMDMSGPAAIVHALHPRVAIMNNGAKKGGAPVAWQVVRSSPDLEDLWQGHFAVAGGKENNAEEKFIANPDETCQGQWIKVSAQSNGDFTVTNGRNGFSKTYKKKKGQVSGVSRAAR
ncbi:MAG: MBL fold metallo-hydrolase [Candidatus Solibacter usitatus]|nr:MBL fold metallo-hydrolase [Candidatus Solibacter usitatus]